MITDFDSVHLCKDYPIKELLMASTQYVLVHILVFCTKLQNRTWLSLLLNNPSSDSISSVALVYWHCYSTLIFN